jgi:pyridoxamine 5'-phosphate oxidase-like protein
MTPQFINGPRSGYRRNVHRIIHCVALVPTIISERVDDWCFEDGLKVPMRLDLDRVLKESLEKASSHTKKVFGKNPLTGQEIIEMANTKGLMTLASTVGSGGQPHLTPADIVGVEGTLYLGMDLATAQYSRLRKNPMVALMIMEGWKRQAILEGTVAILDMKSNLAAKILEAQKKKTGWTTEALAEFRPEKAFSWRGK